MSNSQSNGAKCGASAHCPWFYEVWSSLHTSLNTSDVIFSHFVSSEVSPNLGSISIIIEKREEILLLYIARTTSELFHSKTVILNLHFWRTHRRLLAHLSEPLLWVFRSYWLQAAQNVSTTSLLLSDLLLEKWNKTANWTSDLKNSSSAKPWVLVIQLP